MPAWFRRVRFTCNECDATQRIPLRRVHAFERFHELDQGQAVLIRCPQCTFGLQIPGPYRTHNGHGVAPDPQSLPQGAFIHETL